MLRNLPQHVGGAGITLLCAAMSAVVVANAYHQKHQFYPTVVYITKSNTSMGVMYLMCFSLVMMFAKMLKSLLFGTLRTVEYEQLIEKFFYAVTETCLAFTVFRDDFSPWFIALFTLLLFMKAFHWLTDFRVDYMERSPVITTLYHVRIATLLVLLTSVDFLLVKHAVHSNMTQGVSVQLVFGFEYAVLLTFAYSIGAKYLCHTIDLRSPNPWENKACYLLYMELIVSFVKCILYVAFLLIMVYIHNFPLFIIRPMYINFKAFKKALRDNIQSRRAIHNMNTLYPDPTEEELTSGDTVCIICREEMTQTAGVKKLPCGHLFHALCLRSWFQRQQTCPTCRLDVLRPPRPAPAPAPPPGPPPAQLRRIEALQRLLQQGPPLLRPAAPPGATTAPATTATTTTTAAPPNLPNLMLPPMFGALGSLPPMPPPPPNFGPLTTVELLEMEGRERSHVEARLRMLRSTQTLVNAAIMQLTQYQEMANRLNLEELINSMPRAAASAAATATVSATGTATSPTATAAGPSGSAATSSLASASTTATTSVSTSVNHHASTASTSAVPAAATAVSTAATTVSTAASSSAAVNSAAAADSSSSDATDPEEVRRRRLERFGLHD